MVVSSYYVNDSNVIIHKKLITFRIMRAFEVAKKAALQSTGAMRLGAAIYDGNRLLSTGFNIYDKTKPGNLGKKEDGTLYDITLHAEQSAVDKIKHYDYEHKSLTLYVVRVSKLGRLAHSKPCNMCIQYMKQYGIKKVRFINKFGIPEEMLIL